MQTEQDLEKLVRTYTPALLRYCTGIMGDAPTNTTAINYFNKRAGLTWDCETYEMSNGCTALLPLCTSNPNSYTYYSTWAFFEKDGILYQLGCTPVAGYSSSTTEEDHAMLKQVLDGFAA